GDSLGQRGAEDLQPVLAADTLIPAAEQEAGVVDVVVEVVVREEEVVHLRGPQAGLDELVRGRRAAVEHGEPAAAEVEDVRGAKAVGVGVPAPKICSRAMSVSRGDAPRVAAQLSRARVAPDRIARWRPTCRATPPACGPNCRSNGAARGSSRTATP